MNLETGLDNIADAFFSIAEEDGKIDILLENAQVIREAFHNEELTDIFMFSNLTNEAYKSALKDALHGNVDPTMENLIYYLVDANVIKSLDKIMTRFIRKCVHKIGAVYGELFTTEVLDTERLHKIEDHLSKQLERKVSLVQKIDKTLIAGIRVEKVRGHVFENSVAQQLRDMEKMLKEEN